MGRVSTPTPCGVRKFLPMQDGATATFDLFEALADHSTGGEGFVLLRVFLHSFLPEDIPTCRWDGDATGLSHMADHNIPIMHQGLSVSPT